jgi:hypothetical protein
LTANIACLCVLINISNSIGERIVPSSISLANHVDIMRQQAQGHASKNIMCPFRDKPWRRRRWTRLRCLVPGVCSSAKRRAASGGGGFGSGVWDVGPMTHGEAPGFGWIGSSVWAVLPSNPTSTQDHDGTWRQVTTTSLPRVFPCSQPAIAVIGAITKRSRLHPLPHFVLCVHCRSLQNGIPRAFIRLLRRDVFYGLVL